MRSRALRAYAFYYEIGRPWQVALRHGNFGYGNVFQAEGPAAAVAVEMHVGVFIASFKTTVAYFVSHSIAPVLESMYEPGFLE